MREILFSTKCRTVAASLSSKAARKECVSVVHFQPFGRSRKRSISGLSWPPSISIMVPLTIIIIGDASMTTRLAPSSPAARRPMGIEAGASLSASGRDMKIPRAEADRLAPASIPMGRIAEVEEVANLVVMLASPMMMMVNGTMIEIDGGQDKPLMDRFRDRPKG